MRINISDRDGHSQSCLSLANLKEPTNCAPAKRFLHAAAFPIYEKLLRIRLVPYRVFFDRRPAHVEPRRPIPYFKCETPNGSTSDSRIEPHRPVSIGGHRETMALMYVVGGSAEGSDQAPQIHWFDLGSDDAHTSLSSIHQLAH